MNLRMYCPPLRFNPEDAQAQRTGTPVVRLVEGKLQSFAWIFLPSGLQVMAPLKRLPVVNANIAIRQGAYHDEKPGTAHALEHLVCKDVLEPGVHPALRPLIRTGLRSNAFTRGEVTCYWAAAPFRSWRALLAGLLEMVFRAHPFIDHRRWKKERPAIIEESLRERNENGRVTLAMRAAAYPAFERMGHPIDGTVEDIERLTAADLIRAYEEAYFPDNAVVVVHGFGRVEPLLRWFEDRPEAYQRGTPHARIASAPLMDRGLSTDLIVPVTGGPSMERVQYVSAPFPNDDMTWRTAWLLNEIMGNGLLNETFRRQRGFAYHIGMAHVQELDGQRHFEVGGRMGRANMDAARAIWDRLWKGTCRRLPKRPQDLQPFIERAIGGHAYARALARMRPPEDLRDLLFNRWLVQSRRRTLRNMLEWTPEELYPLLKRTPRFADLPWQEIRVLPTP